jgi:hypothetical protein
MAGRGRPPKDPGQRRRYNQPARSEWVDLTPLEHPVLPDASGGWPANGRRAWRAWRQDPVTTQWGPSEIFAARELARLYDRLPYHEQRLRMDGLGLTSKGKRDLRWRTPGEVKTIRDNEQQAQVKKLRLIEKEKVA